MRSIIAAAAVTAALAGPVRGEVIASCGPLAGHAYYHPDSAMKESGWQDSQVGSISVFTKSGDKLDLIITGKSMTGDGTWTRSASDHGAPVLHVGGTPGQVMHLLVAWGPVTELYSLDLKGKTLALASLKTGMFHSVQAMVGSCE